MEELMKEILQECKEARKLGNVSLENIPEIEAISKSLGGLSSKILLLVKIEIGDVLLEV